MRKELIKNRYLLIKEIASGGTAVVFQAWDYVLERMIAIKRIQQHLTLSATVIDSFWREVLNAAKLQHENILQVYDFFHSIDNVCYIIMEYAIGKDLSVMLKECHNKDVTLPQELAVKIIFEIAKGLCYAHEKRDEITGQPLGIIHLDISPSNILIYYDGRVKLTDFGIAKAIFAAEKNAVKTFLKGKYHYMSPEQIKGENVDFKSDLFSLGIVFYELLTGKKPFTGKDEYEVMKKIAEAEIDISILPTNLQSIVKKLLAKNPVNRFSSTREFLESIEAVLSQLRFGKRQKDFVTFVNRILPTPEKEIDKHTIQEIALALADTVKEDFSLEKTPIPITTIQEPVEKTVLAQTPYVERRFLFLPIVFAVLLFVTVFEFFADMPYRLTPMGKYLHEVFLCIPVYLDSIPTRAKVSLIDSKGENIIAIKQYSDTTPVEIPRVSPGDYTILLRKEKFDEIIRKITIPKQALLPLKKSRIEFIIPFEVKLQIKSVPPGADVFIDGKDTGLKTPAAISLKAAMHTVKLHKAGFLPVGSEDIKRGIKYAGKCELDLLREKHELDEKRWQLHVVTLTEKKVYELTAVLEKAVSIHTIPEGAIVWWSDTDQFLGETPLIINLKAGKYAIKISKKDYETLTPTIEIHDHSSNKFVFPLKQEKVKIYINSFPQKATVYIDGKKTNIVTPGVVYLEKGLHAIRLYKKNLLPTGSMFIDEPAIRGQCKIDLKDEIHEIDDTLWKLTSSVTSGKKVYTLYGILEKRITIETNPINAKVYLADINQYLGRTPLTTKMRLGKYSLRISKKNYDTISTEIEVKEGNENHYKFVLYKSMK